MIALGLGSSDRDALGWLRRTLAALKSLPGLRIQTVSPIYESDALLPENAPAAWNVPYLNLVVACELTSQNLTPLVLLDQLKTLEKKLGRQERERWAPREIDIDLLVWSGVRMRTEKLSLPHSEWLKRPFVLLPLADAAPELLAHEPQALAQIRSWSAAGASVPFRTRKTFRRLTELVAILNLTPDSFSDGGKLADPESIFQAARIAVDSGASVLDLGAESTRPGAPPVTLREEWRRLEPALQILAPLRAEVPGLKLSLDSRHAETHARALESGAPLDWLNDVTGFASEAMRAIARTSRTHLVVMHSLSIPPRRELTIPEIADPLQALLSWGRDRLEELASQGIDPARVILDPGLGFGKTPEQNFEIMRRAQELHAWGARLLVGHSRKSFLSSLQPSIPAAGRDLETAILSAKLADQGIEYLRVHDPDSQARALKLSAAWDGTARYTRPRVLPA